MSKILLVEDNELNRDMLGRRLKRRGYELVAAVDGKEGVAKAQTDKPDLILMDMSLPIMDGWTATKKLKADPNTASIPVIALTAHAMVGDREHALAAGCDDYDTKPVEIKRLLGKIEVLLTAAQAIPAAPTSAEPIAAVPPVERSIPQSANGDRAEGKILIVDDIEENRDMLSRRLFRKNYETILADSGEAALALLGTTNISLVLLDIMMPGIGGIETLRRIRQRFSRLELPVIMVTAKDSSEDIVQSFSLGANDYVTKPIDLSVLTARIQAQLKTIHLSPATAPAPEPVSEVVVSEPVERYRPIKVLAQTPISQTFTAQDLESSDQPLKIVQKIELQTHDPKILETAKQLFADEIKQLAMIRQHDDILLPIDAYEEEGTFYLISEYVEGYPFAIADAGIQPGDARKTVRVTEAILRIIEILHYGNVSHYQLEPSCFIVPRQREGKLILIDLGVQNRLILKLKDIYPSETFLPADEDSSPSLRTALDAIDQKAGIQTDIGAIGLIAMQMLTGEQDLRALEALRCDESKWLLFSTFNSDLVAFLKKMVCQTQQDAYTFVPDASRDILKLWFNLNYKEKTAQVAEAQSESV